MATFPKEDLRLMSRGTFQRGKKKKRLKGKEETKLAAQEQAKEEQQFARDKVEEAAGRAAAGVKVKRSQLDKAVKALVHFTQKRLANPSTLKDSDVEAMYLLFTMSEIPDRRWMKPVLVPLPHPMFDGTSEVCFISQVPQKEYKELLMQKHRVPGITKVLGLDRLRHSFKETSQKHALADSCDLFLCDARVSEMIPKLLGKAFCEKKKKRPIPVRLAVEDPAPGICRAIASTMLRVPSGHDVGVRFGRCSMDDRELLENAAAVIAKVVRHLWRTPVISISMQAMDSPALPVWSREAPADETRHLVDDTPGQTDKQSELASLLAGGEASQSDLDEKAGDVDRKAPTDMPLIRGFKRKRVGRRVPLESPEEPLNGDAAAGEAVSPKKKAKRKGKGRGKGKA